MPALDTPDTYDDTNTATIFSKNHNDQDAPTGEVPLNKIEQSSERDVSDSAETKQPLADEEGQYPRMSKLILIVLSLNLAMFLVGLDNTILSSAIPKITDKFHALGDVGWYASAYLLTNCSFMLIWGKLLTFYSTKWTYLVALFIFELGSLICGVAPTSMTLIIGRAIAGVGSGGVGTGTFILAAQSVPRRQRPVMVGLVGAMYGFAAIAGPLMGGAFTDNAKLTWRWCFYINLPLGFFTAIIILLFIPSTTPGSSTPLKKKVKQMDLPGTACLLPGVICLLLALQWGGTKYAWSNGRVIALLVLAGVLLVCFIVIQSLSDDRGTVPPRVFCNRNIWGSALFGSCVTAAFFVMLYYIPMWFQAIKGASAIGSGVRCLPMILGFVIFSFMGGGLTSFFGYYIPFVYLTVILMSIGSGLLTTLKVNSGHAEWIGYQFIFGAGVGFGLQVAFSAPQTCLPMADVPVGTAIIMFTENLTAAVLVSVAQTTFTNELVSTLKSYAPSIDSKTVFDAGATGLKSQVPPQLYNAVIQAYNVSLAHTYYVGVGLSCCSILGAVWLEWISVKAKRPETGKSV
ncbi:Fc.00g048700.m01.CDS01 [Cosmosporella sp. VM-42]